MERKFFEYRKENKVKARVIAQGNDRPRLEMSPDAIPDKLMSSKLYNNGDEDYFDLCKYAEECEQK